MFGFKEVDAMLSRSLYPVLVATLQVQSDSAGRQVVDAFYSLAEEDQRVLAFEMALTGLAGQTYAHGSAAVGGPAFLVYYSPAFLRSAVRDDGRRAMDGV